MSLQVTNLHKRFTQRGTPAVADVSFTAPAGAITTLLGPSGSGKSTVLRIVAGLEHPDTGAVSFAGEDLTGLPVQKRNLGFVFQSYALFTHMTVAANIGFGLSLRKVAKREIDQRVAELLEQVSLRDLGGRYPAQLSGGQRQRVAFARALAIRPRLLLLDEPFGALDAAVRHELRDWLRRFHAEHHVTTLLVTHDQEEAMELSEHVVVMHEGKVAQAGAPTEIYDRPATPFVASFVGGANLIRRAGEDAHAFVRPHDVRVTRAPEQLEAALAPDDEVSLARIERIARLGAQVKLTLRRPDGEAVTVSLSRGELDALGLVEGDSVMVDVREAKVFVEDYSI